MFIGIIGRQKGIPDRQVVKACNGYARAFENRFGSLQCSILRPEGFNADNPPHLCEPLTNRTVAFAIEVVLRWIEGA